jgi:hypothetical protein
MYAVFAPSSSIQSRTFCAMNSGPLSDRMNRGGPRWMKRSVSASRTSVSIGSEL